MSLMIIEDESSPEPVQPQKEDLSENTEKVSADMTDHPDQEENQIQSSNTDHKTDTPENMDETKGAGQRNNSSDKNPELQDQPETKEDESSPEPVQLQKEDLSENTEKASADMTDHPDQEENQIQSNNTDHKTDTPENMDETKEAGQRNNSTFFDLLFINAGKHSETKVNVVLLGMAGSGKSASGNTILGKKSFISKPSSKPITTECQAAETRRNGLHLFVIDTPDIFDDEIKSSVKSKHVKKCKQLCKSEPCVYLVVMHVSRFTDGERDIVGKLEKAFGSKVKEKTVVLFTRGDDLQQGEITFEEFLHKGHPGLREIIKQCGNRCVLFENRKSSSQQVKNLIDTVTGLLE
uniref:GTPase IMAP family member 7-like n=1 Tax=Maylandia zebra TaxID=106582 RepID=UPI000D3091E5|nr:GTPase IMAP family member 7-like [Maylandia zebra]